MKTFRLFYVLAALLLTFACTDDPEGRELPGSDPAPNASGHTVPVETALEELNSVLAEIDGPGTRSGGPRQVGSVATVKAAEVLPATRSDAAPDIEDLVYIANFENGEGYAILGADDRLETVIAIIEQGSLSAEEFKTIARGAYDETATGPALPYVAAYALGIGGGGIGGGGIGGGGIDHGPIDPGDVPPIPTIKRIGPWETVEKTPVLVPMKWDQEDPYNYYAPLENGLRCYAGCVAVATGQILATIYYRYPHLATAHGMEIGHQKINWDLIYSSIEDNKLHKYRPFEAGDYSAKSLEIAHLLRMIGKEVYMDYHSDGRGSTAQSLQAKYFLERRGFKSVACGGYAPETCARMIADANCPVYFAAKNEINGRGHAWVLDGVYRQKRRIETCRLNGEVLFADIHYQLFFHCNFGYGGSYDGYYSSVTFDLRKKPEAWEPDMGDFMPSKPLDRVYSQDRISIVYLITWP